VNSSPADFSHTFAIPRRRVRDRYWLHAVLLIATLWSATAVGARLAYNFHLNRPALIEDDLFGIVPILFDPVWLIQGLPYSIALLTILFAHEMGHYMTCRYYGIDVSLPYFLPAPTLIGTFGAFIRIRSAIFSKRQLFDIGVAGPIAGFVFLLPLLAIGIAYSKIIPGIEQQSDFIYGTPLMLRVLEWVIFPGIPSGDIHLHPIARAAWVGLLATALNLLPIGQLDGGHILYALFGRYHRPLTTIFILALIPLGLFYSPSWLFWAAVLFILARRHPRIYDETPVGSGRVKLGLLALVILLVSFSAAPIHIR
jgi:membrane-associated protease RseP (regulator of RpoE activity)